MGAFFGASARALRRARSLRMRAGVGRTFGSLFLVLSALMLALGALALHDAIANPLTADAGQVMIGSVCLAICLLLLIFLVRQRV